MKIIRKAKSADAPALHNLYFNHLRTTPPKEPQDMVVWGEMIARFEQNPFYYLLVNEINGVIVSAVTLVIIENLTYNNRPYAVIENVVTHADYRGKNYATELMEKASDIAAEHGCYKIMLFTGSKKDSILGFYEKCEYRKKR